MDDGRRPRGDHRGGDEIEGADVIQRSTGQADVGVGESELRDVRVVLPRQVGVGDHDALRPPGGSGRVHQPVDVITLDVGTGRGSGLGTQIREPLPPAEALGRDAHTDEVATQLARGFAGEVE